MAEDDTGLHFRPLPRIGQELGRFIIEKQLPRGGQARVYRAWQTDLQRPVALKLLPSSYAADLDTLTRFRREIENVARVSHPNIVRVFEAGEIEGNPFFTMDFVEGHDAEDILRKGPIGPDEAATIMEAVARAVAAAHQQGIIHRDIKPGNIIVRGDGTPVLTDFGLAQDLSSTGQLTQTGISMGTPAYMAPEQARGERHRVGIKSDVYSLGATLYTLLTAKRPVEGDSAYELMLKVAESNGPKWPRQAAEDVPPDLRAIVEMAMAHDPAARYEGAAELADDLERYLHGEWVVARSRGKLARAWLKTRRYVPVAAVVVIALGLASGMIYTGLNPAFSANGAQDFGDRTLFIASDNDEAGELAQLFQDGGTWTQHGGTVRRGSDGELVLERTAAEPLFISPKDPACWGDFTLQCELRAAELDGPLQLLIGLPESLDAAEAAYGIVIGAGARDRVELRRHGVPVLSAYRAGQAPVLAPETWYRATVTRNGQALSFVLSEIDAEEPAVSFSIEDPLPAFAGLPRRRFAVAGEAGRLGLRAVTVVQRDTQHPAEALLFSVGDFAEAELRVGARLAMPLSPEAGTGQRNARAGLHFLRARCLERMGRYDEADADCDEARTLANDPALRASIYLLSALIRSAQGDDDAALARLGAAQISAGARPQLNSWLLHAVAARAAELRQSEPRRALRYYDFVSSRALGNTGLVCGALYAGAEIRLEMAQSLPADADNLRADAMALLERVEGGNYLRFGNVYAPAMATLFGLYREDPETPIEAVLEAAEWMRAAVGGYGVEGSILVQPLVTAAWSARLTAGTRDPRRAQAAAAWLDAAAQAGADLAWIRTQQALAATERPEVFGDSGAREALWREAAESLALDEPAHAIPEALVAFFLDAPTASADLERRQNQLRRALRAHYNNQPNWWLAEADADRFADYCIALATAPSDHNQATGMLEAAAAQPRAGEFKLLEGRAAAWLPISR